MALGCTWGKKAVTPLRERRQKEQLMTGRKNCVECRKEEQKLEKFWSKDDTIPVAEKHKLKKSLEEMSVRSALL